MTKLNYNKVTGSEQDNHNKVAANSTNNAVKNPEILTRVWDFIDKAAERFPQGF